MRKNATRILLACILVLFTIAGFSQQRRTVTGTLQDNKGVPVSGASVIEKGTPNGTTSNTDGTFTLSVLNNAVLTISAIGYETQDVNTGTNASVTVVLNPASTELGGVVVTALGVTKQRRELGYSVTELKGSEVARTNEINPINALQGKVAGVQIDQGAGGLFGNSKIVIRGNSTLGTNNQPIFVIDGVIMDNGTFGGTGRDFGNDFKNLNPEDFASVSILKGSAAAALYGSRAINGVVLITTKKGSSGKGMGVSVTQSVNVSDPYAGPDFQNEFGGGTVGAFFTDNREPNYKPEDAWRTKVFPIDPLTGEAYIDRQIYRELENWGPRMLGQEVRNYDGTPTRYLPQPNNFLDAFETGLGSNTNIALDGATEKSTFRLSYNHNQGKGVVPTNKFTKNAFDVRATHQLTKAITIDASAAYSNFAGENPPRLGGLDAFASYNFGKLFSWMLPRNYDTKYWRQKANYTSILGGAPQLNDPNEPNKAPESRFWFNLYENKYLQNEQLLRGRINVTANLTSWAKLMVEGNINNVYIKKENKELGELQNFAGGLYGIGFEQKKSNFLKAMLMMNKDFNEDFSVSGYIGAEQQRFENTFSYNETRGGLNYPGNYFITNSREPGFVEAGISSSKKFNSLYASADFGWKNMVFLQATWRGDWSSALTYSDGSGNNFFNYPALSASWIFTDAFKSLPSFISYGKLRGNIAWLGADTDPFTINPGFAFNGFNRANGGSVPTSTFNSSFVLQENLLPSRKFSRELGLEMRFLQSKIGFDFTYYQDNTKNQILPIDAPFESGATSILINAGNIQNQGIEISVDATPITTSNFRWNTALNYSRNRNKIVELYDGRTEYQLPGTDVGEISSWAIVGGSYGTLRTLIQSTAYQAKDGSGNNINDAKNGLPILSWRSDARAAFPARSNVWQDVGDMNAKFRGGWDNTFTFKNFSLNILIDAKIGGDFALMSYRQGTHSGVFPNSVYGRDAQSGGITFTSKYDNQTYDDGRIVQGVFAPGQMITQPDGSQVNVGGLSFQEAYDAGYVEPTHTPQFFYRYGSSSTGVSDFWVLENSWISLRQVALAYNFPKSLTQRLKLNNLSFAVIGRDLFYLYQTLPHNFNPASNSSNNTAFSGENGFLPKTRNITFTLRTSF
ncbi:MAG: SusC/RagA family TonB-linked outer membrane protein [Chitinophagaceae bacterium]|nr:MAG: SusC/RagA family TonB-linked outer membrane protein [Chitinophagaceae bacterium]